MVCVPLVAMILSVAASLSRRQQLSPVVTGDRDVENHARLGRRGKPHRRELRRCGRCRRARSARVRRAPTSPSRWRRSAASPFSRRRRARSLTTSPATCGMRAAGVPGRGENGNTCRCVSPHSSTRSSERANIVLGLGRKARDDVAAEHDVGPQPPHLLAEGDGVGARMAALHALEDHVVAGLQRQMQMRHQPRLVGERVEQVGVGLDRIDGRQAQPLELGHVRAGSASPAAEPSAGRSAVARDVDAGQHDLARAVLDQTRAPAPPRRPSGPSANCRGRTG